MPKEQAKESPGGCGKAESEKQQHREPSPHKTGEKVHIPEPPMCVLGTLLCREGYGKASALAACLLGNSRTGCPNQRAPHHLGGDLVWQAQYHLQSKPKTEGKCARERNPNAPSPSNLLEKAARPEKQLYTVMENQTAAQVGPSPSISIDRGATEERKSETATTAGHLSHPSGSQV